jgi:molybdenum cofactor cytidylyltransferase
MRRKPLPPKKAEVAAVANAMPTIATIVLAAGSSQRMGEHNKLHLPIDGVSLLRRSLQTLLAANVDDIVVVLGHEQKSTRALIDDLPLQIVYNGAHNAGQMTSVHCGLAALEQCHDGVIIALGDQPALTVADINYLIDAYRQRSGGEVVVPTFNGQRGNPIIISESCRADILAGTRNLGCRKFIDKNPELVCKVEMPNSSVLIDLDTPQEYENYCKSQSRSPGDASAMRLRAG